MRRVTVYVSRESREFLRQLAAESGEPISVVLGKAIEAYRRQRILDETNAAYATLRADPDAWREELEERRAWEATLSDGLTRDP